MRTILCLTLALLPTIPITATSAPLRVKLNAQVETLNGEVRGVFETNNPNPAVQHIGDTVPARVGERLKISLVGIEDDPCPHQQVPVRAQFSVLKTGILPSNISIIQTGPNWVVVNLVGPGTTRLDFNAYAGHDLYSYKLGSSDKKGNIVFDIGHFPKGYTENRWLWALDLNRKLHRAILHQTANDANAHAQLIYQKGLQGVLSVARTLAETAERQGLGKSKFESENYYRVAGLYCSLLDRHQTRDDLFSDASYIANVHVLASSGLLTVVNNIVNSTEFRSVNGF